MSAPLVSIQARTYSSRIAIPVVRVELCLEQPATPATANPPDALTIAPTILTPIPAPTPDGGDFAHAFMSKAETELLDSLLKSVQRWEYHNDSEGSSRQRRQRG